MPDSPTRFDDDHTEAEPRYAVIDLLDDEIVIYDLENDRAWIQSDVAVEPDAMT